MEIESVIMNCDNCETEHKGNYLITTTKNYSLALCYNCLQALVKESKNHIDEE